MTSIPTRCGVCGQFFESKYAKRKHVDMEHRITDADITIKAVVTEDAGAGQ